MKITAEQRRQIKERIAAGEKGNDLAKEFGVTKQAISSIKHDRPAPKKPRKTSPLTERRCRICQKTKPLDQFYRSKTVSGGRLYLCIPCNNRETVKASNRRLLRKDRAAFEAKLTRTQDIVELMKEVLEEERTKGSISG